MNYRTSHWAVTAAAVCAIAVSVIAAPATPVKLDLEGVWAKQYDTVSREISQRSQFERIADQVFRADSMILKGDSNPLDVILRRTAALAKHIQSLPGAPKLTAPLAALGKCQAAAKNAKDETARRKLFTDVARIRREISLSNPLLDFDKIAFIKSHRSRNNHCCDQYFGFNARAGGTICVLSDPFGSTPLVRDILANAKVSEGRLTGTKLDTGSFRSLDLSYDGKEILFAYAECGEAIKDAESLKGVDPDSAKRMLGRWTRTKSFHVFRANVDGTGLRQLTDGPWNDFDPVFLPNGRIAMISERRGGFGRCHGRPVPTYTLYSMNGDGGDILPLSYHETNEWQPSVNHDGMIVYTRWDYIDRGDCIAHHPWITYPDGRDPRAMHGNYPTSRRARPDQEMSIRAIPNSPKYVATAAPHHGQAYGSLVIFDPRLEDDGEMGPIRRLTPEVRFPEVERGGQVYGSAWPLSDDYHLCVYSNARAPHGVYLVDSFGNKELLYADSSIACLDPMPLRPRTRPPVIPHATAVGKPNSTGKSPAKIPANAAGTVAVMNVYDSLKPWPEGTKVKALRVIQLFPKSTYNINVPDIGIGSESLARGVLGTVPVEADGSAHFTAPAGKLIYFQALDAAGLAIQSMQSGTYVHPGEKLVCQGCHEPRHKTASPSTNTPLAMRRAPSVLAKDAEGSWPLAYPRLVQPVLDRSCVPCHTKNAKKGAPDLTNKPTTWRRPGYGGGVRTWSASYVALTTGKYNEGEPNKGYAFAFSSRPPDRRPTRTVPGQFGAKASKLYPMLTKGHHNVKLSKGDLHRITLWLDCNSNFFGANEDPAKQLVGERVLPAIE